MYPQITVFTAQRDPSRDSKSQIREETMARIDRRGDEKGSGERNKTTNNPPRIIIVQVWIHSPFSRFSFEKKITSTNLISNQMRISIPSFSFEKKKIDEKIVSF